MKRIISLVLCFILSAFVCVIAGAENQGLKISTFVPQVACTIESGKEYYSVYYNGERVDGTTFYVNKNAPVVLTIEPGDDIEIIYAGINGKQIHSNDGTSYLLSLAENENVFDIYVNRPSGFFEYLKKLFTDLKAWIMSLIDAAKAFAAKF